MRWLKGVVQSTKGPEVLIELDTGRRVWATPPFKLFIQEHILISWDYTNDYVGIITTKERWASTETERDRIEEASMIDVSQNPSDEELEGDLSDLGKPSSTTESTQGDEEESTSMFDVFQNPLGEDVDCDSIVELRYDFTH